MSEYILGLSLGHDASAVLVHFSKGKFEILGAASEERFTRHKDEDRFPTEAINYVVSLLPPGKELSKITYSTWEQDEAFNFWDRWLKQHQIPPTPYIEEIIKNGNIAQYRREKSECVEKAEIDRRFHHEMFVDILRDKCNLPIDFHKIKRHNHHLSHAVTAWLLSGYQSPLIVTIDGMGDRLSASVSFPSGDTVGNEWSPGVNLEYWHGVGVNGSLGLFYNFVTTGLGFEIFQGTGKVMALAASGNGETVVETFKKFFLSDDNHPGIIQGWNISPNFIEDVFKNDNEGGIWHPIPEWNEFLAFGKQVEQTVQELLKSYSREDIAAGAQTLLETFGLKIVLQAISKYKTRTQSESVALAVGGGVFANVKLNQRIAALEEVESLYVTPPMGDPGVALGSAFVELCSIYKIKMPLIINQSMSLGPEYSDIEIYQHLLQYQQRIEFIHTNSSEDLWEYCANYLAQGKIIARFQGRMEFGPRALGNRSVYSPAHKTEYAEILNRYLHRDFFMPFAPMTLESFAKDSYLLYEKVKMNLKFMTISLPVSEDFARNYPAVTHIDHTARPQIVGVEDVDSYGILTRYYERTGLHTFINTSFNIHRQPIVCSPEDALKAFLVTDIDLLAIGGYLVHRKLI